jgi:hypothetical protein
MSTTHVSSSTQNPSTTSHLQGTSSQDTTPLEDKVQKLYNDVTTNRLWRHTIGRATSLVKVAIYSIGFCAQAVKTISKAVFSPFVSLAVWFGGGKQHEWSWTCEGVAKDAIMIAGFADRMIGAGIGIACAPHKKSNSILNALEFSFDTFSGGYHSIRNKKTGKAINYKASEMAYGWETKRAEWTQLVFDNAKNEFPKIKPENFDTAEFRRVVNPKGG